MRIILFTIATAYLLIAGMASPVAARTWLVPDEAPTIAAGIDSAAVGDTVQVACGTYYEHSMDLKTGVVIRSETGQADCVTVDGESLGRVFIATSITDARLEGISVTNGLAGWGAGIFVNQSTVTIEDCVFYGNTAHAPHSQGGGICVEDGHVTLRNVTVVGNSGSSGGGLAFFYSTGTIENSIIAFNTGVSAHCYDSSVTVSCTDIYGNSGGDWVNCFLGQQGLNGNFELDPLFCNTDAKNFQLQYDSPCLDAVGCGLVGAFGFGGCGDVWHVPDDASTIQAGIDAAVFGDTVVVACDTYYEHAIELKTGVVVRSETGQADCVTVDGETLSRVFIASAVTDARLEGFSVTNGLANWGAGIFVNQSVMTIEDCIFYDNTAELPYSQGGGICVEDGDVTLRNITAVGNSAYSGGGLAFYYSTGTIENSIIAFNSGESAYCHQSAVTASCTDAYGNSEGDWIDCFAGQQDLNGNMNGDPFFCPDPYNQHSLDAISPCLPANNDCGVLMGALGEGCDLLTPVSEEPLPLIPDHLFLAQNTPNPFNPLTHIDFGLPEARRVQLTIYDLRGRWVVQLVDGELPAGTYRVPWQGRDEQGLAVASGTYVCCLEAGTERQTRRMTLIR